MSATPKFEVIDRRKMKAAEEQEQPVEAVAAEPEKRSEAGPGLRLVVNEGKLVDEEPAAEATLAEPEPAEEASVTDDPMMPPAPTAEEVSQQKAAYDVAAERLETLVRAQNPAAGAPPVVGFEHLVQQLYLSAMIQMGAGGQEGQRPRIDILGAKNTIELISVLADKTRSNLTEAESRMIDTVLFDVRMAFLELTSMISMQAPTPPSPTMR
jgi:hypothetical protein